MIPVTLEYKPISFIPWRRKVDSRLPAHWYELTARQLESVPLIMREKLNDNRILKVMLNVPHNLIRRMSPYEKYCILRNLKYLDEIDSCHFFIIPCLGSLHAPGERLKDVSFASFIFGDTYYQNYLAGHKEDLYRFIACYYLKDKFTDKDIERNALRISRYNPVKLEAIAVNYGLIREWLARSYPYVFQKADQNKKAKNPGWVAVFDSLVGDNIADQDKWSELPVSMVLRYLNRKTKQAYKDGRL